MSALADAHIASQQHLRQVVDQALAARWLALPGYDEADVATFLAGAVPLVTTGQRQAALLTAAFLGRATAARPRPVDFDAVTGAAVRAGTDPAEVYRRPFVTVWTALKAGRDKDRAIAAGLARARSTAAMDMQLAMRQTLVHVGEVDEAIVGYTRVPDAGACEFCLLVSGQRYRTDQLMPLHNRCGCSVDVITTANRGDFTGRPENDLDVETAAVQEHGELGPVLVDAEHDFTQL